MNIHIEIERNWEYAWDCLVDSKYGNEELASAFNKVPKLDNIQKAIVRDIIHKVCIDNTHAGICHWGLSDTPTREHIIEDIENKIEDVISILNKYSESVA
jgi:hypothetical protein